MRTLKKFQQITEIVSNQFINSAPQKELQRALKSNLYWEHNQVKLNAKKEVLQKELIRINKLIEKTDLEKAAKSAEGKVETTDIKDAIAKYLKIDRDMIAYAVDCPASESYDVDLKDGKKWGVSYSELGLSEKEVDGKAIAVKTETIKQENIKANQESIKTVKRTVRKSPQDKIDWVKNIAAMVERTSIKVAAYDLGKSVTYISRTYRAYTEAYLANTKVKNAFDNKAITWTQLHKLAEKKITSDRLEEFASQI